MSSGQDLTILVAVAAGVVSFLSPCVLPLVPAYLGQLTAIAVAGAAPGAAPSRWLAVRHSIAYVAGFGAVFTLLGATATFAAQGFVDYLPALRVIGGIILIVLGLSLAGILQVPGLERTWRPLDAGAAGSLATATGTVALGSPGSGSGASGPGLGDRLGSRLVDRRGGWLASFGLGAIFAIGWTPCIGIILSGILSLAISSGTVAPGDGPSRGIHAGPRPAVHRDRRRLRPRAGPLAATRPPRADRVADRRAPRRRDRRRDGLRLAEPAAALLQLHDVRLTAT